MLRLDSTIDRAKCIKFRETSSDEDVYDGWMEEQATEGHWNSCVLVELGPPIAFLSLYEVLHNMVSFARGSRRSTNRKSMVILLRLEEEKKNLCPYK
jgi:hypothetical protein